jgi:hypothetical protein
MLRTATIAIVLVLAATACSGDGDDAARTTPTESNGNDATSSSIPSTPDTVDECSAEEPPNLHSTSHEVNIRTSKQVIEMEWDVPTRQPASYAYAFSQNPEEPPDQVQTLPGTATVANSGPLGDNRWYFYLIEAGGEPVRCGPYVIDRDAASDNGEGDGGNADSVTLSISVTGGSSVEFFTNGNERLFCGDTSLSGHDTTCGAQFIRGSEARIQRTLGLSDEEEARWRLAGWAGACEDLDADTEPRGGQCILVMDEGKDVNVSFEERAKITIAHSGPPQLLLRWGLQYSPQNASGNPLTLRGQFDCDTDVLADCTKTAFFDKGTTITLTAGTGVDNGNLASISGACSTNASTCEFTIESDSDVTFNWKY